MDNMATAVTVMPVPMDKTPHLSANVLGAGKVNGATSLVSRVNSYLQI